MLASPLTDPTEMIKACCAYCLVTSSSSIDALKHVQRLRLDRLHNLLSLESLSQQILVDVLRYQLDSLEALKRLAGRPLIDALGSLQRRPILEDQLLNSIELLDLRNMGALLPEEIRSFMPYFKRTPLVPKEVQQMLDTWSDEARQAFSSGLGKYLETISSCSDLVQLRQKLYMVLLPVYFSTAGQNRLHETLSTAFEDRVIAISEDLGQRLSSTSFELKEFESELNPAGLLWRPEVSQMPLTNGGQGFLQQVRRRRLGRSTRQAKSSKMIKAWASSVQMMHEELVELRKTRWRDHLEEPDDEQEGEAVQILNALTQNDPVSYLGHLQRSLMSAVAIYESTLSEAVAQLVNRKESGQMAVNLIRAIRDSIDPLQRALRTQYQFDKLQSAVPQLHGLIAAEVVSQLSNSESAEPDVPSLSNKLEDLPSPRAFTFVQRLCSLMREIGSTDVWSPGAVRAVKEAVASHVFHDHRKKHYMETTFDDGYLRIVLEHRVTEEGMLASPQNKPVEEYWSRDKAAIRHACAVN